MVNFLFLCPRSHAFLRVEYLTILFCSMPSRRDSEGSCEVRLYPSSAGGVITQIQSLPAHKHTQFLNTKNNFFLKEGDFFSHRKKM